MRSWLLLSATLGTKKRWATAAVTINLTAMVIRWFVCFTEKVMNCSLIVARNPFAMNRSAQDWCGRFPRGEIWVG
jgi:hypothetical protein